MTKAKVAFLFLGETLLIPHLWPVADALARREPTLPIDVWISTPTHEALLSSWLPAGTAMRLRRAPLFGRGPPDPAGRNPVLPPKLAMLAALAPRLARVPVVVCVERTSLWLPTLLPLKTRFIDILHGVGSVGVRDGPRRRAAWLHLVPSELERAAYLRNGFRPDAVIATGYNKASFRRGDAAPLRFAAARPVLLYTPHWQQHRSSWWAWGRGVLDRLVAQDRWNIIFAPHQRLAEKVPGLAALVAELDRLPHVHADLDSFAMVDGSYTAAADLYLGDTSSQVVEFLARPRPCVFLNALGTDWRAREDHGFWRCGDVVEGLDGVMPAIDAAGARHGLYAEEQRRFAAESLGDVSGAAPGRCAEAIVRALAR